MLHYYFKQQEYEVDIAPRGLAALEKTRSKMPNLILLDIMLPDIDGYEVCRTLRLNKRTSHIPVIFLTQKDERSDKIQGLELGVDDYITKPFDFEELKLRVQNAITRAERESLTDPRSGLPAGQLIEDQLRQIIRETGWVLIDICLTHFQEFKETYGFIAGDDVIRSISSMIRQIVDENGTMNDFIGHADSDNFIVITEEKNAKSISTHLKKCFEEEILKYYNFIDREQGFITTKNVSGETTQVPLMSLSVGVVSPTTHHFADIREITELAVDSRKLI
jgi:DNA-binding response OmpR family regulator